MDIFDDIAGIINKIEPSFLERNWVWIAGIIFAFAAVAAYMLLRKKAVRALTPFELAQIRLGDAKKIEDSKLYASALSSAVRDYVGVVFGMPAPERTTEEFLQIALASDSMPKEEREKIAEILTLSDMAKFARMSFDSVGRDRMFELAQSFIAQDNAKRAEADKK